tara:strand:+ start:26 stop:205 length:180 start_codon:yes stop_codon:yes gene_type:complete
MKITKKEKSYTSEITNFLKHLKQKNPNLEQRQYNGRAILWDKEPLTLDKLKRINESEIK